MYHKEGGEIKKINFSYFISIKDKNLIFIINKIIKLYFLFFLKKFFLLLI